MPLLYGIYFLGSLSGMAQDIALLEFAHCPASFASYVAQLRAAQTPQNAAAIERELSPLGFQQYFRLLRKLANVTQARFLAETQKIAGTPFAWEHAFHPEDNARNAAAQWALGLFADTFGDWSYAEKSAWWVTDHDIFVLEYGSANRCLECGVDLGAQNPRQLCGKTVCR